MITVAQNLVRGGPATKRGVVTIVRWPRIQSLIGFGLFMVAYYFAYRFGMTFSQTLASPFWFPDSVLLCALLLSPRRFWWVFIVATLPIRLPVAVPAETPLWFLVTTFMIDSTKGVLTAVLLRRFLKNPLRLQTYQDFGVYCFFAVLLIPALNAFVGAGARQFLGYAYWPAWAQTQHPQRHLQIPRPGAGVGQGLTWHMSCENVAVFAARVTTMARPKPKRWPFEGGIAGFVSPRARVELSH